MGEGLLTTISLNFVLQKPFDSHEYIRSPDTALLVYNGHYVWRLHRRTNNFDTNISQWWFVLWKE